MKIKEQTSLSSYLRLMYLTHPGFLRVRINNRSYPSFENPFNRIPLSYFTDRLGKNFQLKTTKLHADSGIPDV